MKRLLSLFLALFLFFSLVKTTFAADNFSTTYNVNYTVSSNANTHVDINVVMTNLSDQYYAASYKILLGFTNIKNAKASDSNGQIIPRVEETGKGSSIELAFNKPTLGVGNKSTFTFSFDTSEVAQNIGDIWEINIPGIAAQNDFSQFNVNVFYPSYLGQPSFIKPDVGKAYLQPGKLSFSKDQLGSSGISISFGNYQVYKLGLVYHLENTNLFPITTDIALPPSTNYQDIEVEDINPKPMNITTDNDGNWLARYYLNPSQKIDVNVTEKAKVFYSPKEEVLDKNQINEYLKPKPYWEVNNSEIQKEAKYLKTPSEIYNYVVGKLNYDFLRVTQKDPRLGAAKTLQNPDSAVCLEFTDLFVALARAAGIPAREVDGYGYTKNSKERPLSLVEDILHAWPEYYDSAKRTWVMVDPTWGNTTGGVDYFNVLDFDHIAFVIKGYNSSYPVPAGGYKLASNKNSKDVTVELSGDFGLPQTKVETEGIFPANAFPGFPVSGTIRVKNTGKFVSTGQKITLSTNILKPGTQTLNVGTIPPFGYVDVPVNFDKTPILTNAVDQIKITDEKNTYIYSIKISPFFFNKWIVLGVISVVSFIIIILIIAIGSRSLSLLKRKQRSDLRWESQEPPQKS